MRADAPIYLSETTRMVASIIREVGTPALKDRILAGAMNGDITIALGFTEPECGSDVAAAATKAVRDGDEWVINGSKMFTTNGHIADYMFLLARTSPDKPKHKGLTMFLVPPSLTASKHKQCGRCQGSARTSRSTATSASATSGGSAKSMPAGRCLGCRCRTSTPPVGARTSVRLLHHAEQWARNTARRGRLAPIANADVRRRIARVAMEVEVSMLLQRRCVWMTETGRNPGGRRGRCPRSSAPKLSNAPARTSSSWSARTHCAVIFEPTAPEQGRLEHLTAVLAGHHNLRRHQ